jgi:phage regulator Rha-like protein
MNYLSVQEFSDDDETLVVDSRIIADRLNLDHNDWMSNVIVKYKSITESRFGVLRFKNVKPQIGKGGRPQKIAYLTEDQSYFYVSLSKNSDEVVQFKADLVAAFSEARRCLRDKQEHKFNQRIKNATLKIYVLDDPLKKLGRVFQQNFYDAVYKIKDKKPLGNPSQHPLWMAQVTIDLVYQRLQPGLWDELCKKNPKVDGKRKYCCHQFLSDNIGNPHLRSHLYAVTKMMNGYSTWKEFKYNLDKCHPKTTVVQMDILFDLFSNSPDEYERWHGLVS